MHSREKINLKIKESMLICITICITGVIYFFHWKFELPFHPNVDESISINVVQGLLNGESFLIQVFNYPHLPFYWGGLWCEFVKIFTGQYNMVLTLRIAECGFALLTNICVYFAVKELTGSKRWGYISLLVALFALYQAQYLYYAGPDVMLYGMANITIYIGIKIYKEETPQVVFHKWYPLMAVSIGLATSAKYHGILFGIYWLMLHVMKKYVKSYKGNICFVLNCVLIMPIWLLCNISVIFYFNDFISGISGIFGHYAGSTLPPLVHSNPMLGYLKIFFCHDFGYVGVLLIIIGVSYLFKSERFRKLVVVMAAMSALTLLILGRYNLMLGRNISLIVPFTYYFITFGLYALERFIKINTRKIWINILISIMVCANIFTVVISESYDESYKMAEKWIEDNMPKNATIYLYSKGYSPVFSDRDTVEWRAKIFEGLPSQLGENEYYIAVEYADSRFTQKADFPYIYGDAYVVPEWAETYSERISNYKKIVSFPGITYEHGWRYRIGYFDVFKYGMTEYYTGPTIEIYGSKTE